MFKRAGLLVLVLGSNPVVEAETPDKVLQQQQERPASDVRRMTGGVQISTIENVVIQADEADYNETTGEVVLRGAVRLRQALRPAAQPVVATNRAGAPFPDPTPVVMRVRGGLEISIGDLTLTADEADVNGLTGEMTLGGNVRMIRAKR
jgi:lipopolysaccharide assembly outer membrane protein LptD (OstA)